MEEDRWSLSGIYPWSTGLPPWLLLGKAGSSRHINLVTGFNST
jgi:hypothetical protein